MLLGDLGVNQSEPTYGEEEGAGLEKNNRQTGRERLVGEKRVNRDLKSSAFYK